RDDGDDDDGDSSGDDADGEDEDDEDEEEEEEHLAPPDSAIVVPIDEPVFPPERTKPVIPPPSTDITVGERTTARPTRGRGIDYGFVSMVDAEERRQGSRD
ncbi:hypothetical protein Tco_0555044, partial [Tanacetum coccineum]